MERLTEWYDDGILKGVLVKKKYSKKALKTLFEESDDGYRGMCTLKAYEGTGLTPEQICSIATELKEYKQLELSPKRLSEHVAFCQRYHELFGAIDFSRLMELKELNIAKVPDYEGDGVDKDGNIIYDTWICPNCGEKYEVDYDVYEYCPKCGQAIQWDGLNWEESEGEEER